MMSNAYQSITFLVPRIPQSATNFSCLFFSCSFAPPHGYAPHGILPYVLLSLNTPEHAFPFLVHHLTYGSPIGNPPLANSFIPKNLLLATLLPETILREIESELSAGSVSGPFSIEGANIIFDGHFCTFLLGLVEKAPGDEKWRIIQHLSRSDMGASMTPDFVSTFLLLLLSQLHRHARLATG